MVCTPSFRWTCTPPEENKRSNTPTISFPSSETGKIRASSYCFNGTPCVSNRRLIALGQNCSRAGLRNVAPLGYFGNNSCILKKPVVTLQRPPPEMMTFAHSLLFFSNKCIPNSPLLVGEESGVRYSCSSKVATTIIPAAHPPTMAIRFFIISSKIICNL